MKQPGNQTGNKEGGTMFKCFAWLLLYCLKLTLDSHSDSAQGFKERVKASPLREEKEEGFVGPGFSSFSPCFNGCVGPQPMGGKDKGSGAPAGFDPCVTSFCLGGKGHEDREMGYPGKPLMN
jgi:hypothetical protein